jgi:hypothetical protein
MEPEGVLLAAKVAASAVPGRRASRMDPVITLRGEGTQGVEERMMSNGIARDQFRPCS